jgi:microcystin-dependent protein
MAISITKPTVGGSEDTWGDEINAAVDTIVDAVNGTSGTTAPNLTEGSWQIGGTPVTATAAELNKLDGYTGTATDLNEAIAHYVPTGGIIMWSGAVSAIPTGWVLCDGTNSTPNLVDRFVVGSGTDSGGTHDVGDTGGTNSLTLTEAQLPAHTHGAGTLATNETGDHYHLDGTVMDSGAEDTYGSTVDASATRVDQSQSETKNNHAHTSTAGAHSHTISGNTGSTGSGSSIDNRPAYYALAFIMKT